MNAVPYLWFVLGVGLLIKGADWLVEGASALSRRLGISELVIGLTVVAFGTSLPELIVSLYAAVQGNTAIAMGNILGSNTANILLILGLCACLSPLCVTRSTVWKEIPFSLLAVLVLAVMGNDRLLDAASVSELTRSDGMVMLAFFGVFLYYIGSMVHQNKGLGETKDESSNSGPGVSRAGWLVVIGLVCLVFGGHWTVQAAIRIATRLGVSQSLIGLTLVAVGTSLPELVTSVVAAVKHKADIAVGNVVGSNIFNIFLILGLTTSIKPIGVLPSHNADLGVVVLATLLLFLTMFTGKRHKLDRWEGALMMVGYAAYIVFIIRRG